MAIQDPRNFFLNAVEARMDPADALVARTKKQLQTRDQKRKAGKVNKIVDQHFYAAKDESPEDESTRKRGEIREMLSPSSDEGGVDTEAAMQMDSERRSGLPPKARVVAEDEVMQAFFRKTHGSGFDPKSRVDRAKMDKMLGMVGADPDLLSLSPAKFALKVYASK